MKLILALLAVTMLTGCGPTAAERIAQAKIDSAKMYCATETDRVDAVLAADGPLVVDGNDLNAPGHNGHEYRFNQCILEQEAK